jgi:hypothetical protein
MDPGTSPPAARVAKHETARLALGLGMTAGVVLGLFLIPVVLIPVKYACFGNVSLCSQLSVSTFASVTYVSFHVGAVYVADNTDGRLSRYCWMEGNPVGNPQVNNGAMCKRDGGISRLSERSHRSRC